MIKLIHWMNIKRKQTENQKSSVIYGNRKDRKTGFKTKKEAIIRKSINNVSFRIDFYLVKN